MPQRERERASDGPIRVCLVAIPDVMLSTLTSIYDALNCFKLLKSVDPSMAEIDPFDVKIVASAEQEMHTASGLPIRSHCQMKDVTDTDVVIIPSLMVERGRWVCGRYPGAVQWLRTMHANDAMLCSACSGVLLLAETGLLDGREATVHWAYAPAFRRNFPKVHLRAEQVIVTAGDRREFIMSGASASWHDLVLNLVARHVGPSAAQAIAKFMLLQWHAEGQAPYAMFVPPRDHGDAVILDAQEWMGQRFTISNPVEEAERRSGLASRSFKRRFSKATGFTPIRYIQHLRIEEAKRRLETTVTPIDQISWEVGYEDPAFFRRLFKRITLITPGAYRRKFRPPWDV